MRRIIFPLILCLFCAVFLSACGEETADGMMTPVKDDSGAITGYEVRYHNDNGDITRLDVYDANQEYDHYVLYEYDSDNRLSKETYYRADGIGVYYYAYSYHDDGTLAEKDHVTASEGSERILYDEKGKEKERMTFDNADTLTKYEVYQDGAWVESELPTEAETAVE